MAAFIEAVDLTKTYHVGKVEVPALRGISFSVQKGEFVSIVGPSGSGKSTLFYLLGGLTRADSGHVIVDGADFATLSDAERTRMRKRKIGFVFQKFNLLPTLDARSNIDIALDIAGTNGSRDGAYFSQIVSLLGLEKRLHHRPSELSGGEQQRVALARALINKPAIVLADEPTGNLDSKNSEIVLNMLRHSNKELGQTVLMITHNPQAAEYGDRIIHMREFPISWLHVLETITPYDYHLIRAGLGHGSGLDSPGFLALLHIGPRLGEAFHEELRKANVTVDDVYRRHEELFGLHDLAERLLDFDERVHLFRFHHLKLAQRIIGGGVVGTMGTPVEVLHQRMEHLFYKELWDVRNQITARASEMLEKGGAGHQ